MFKTISKIILISLFAISLAATFTRTLSAQTPPTNESLPQGYEPLDDEARSIQEKVNEQTNDFLSSIRSVIPDDYSPSFNAKVLVFLAEYREYLTDYFRAINEMEPVTGSDAIGSVDDILKEKLGFTTRDLNKKAERLYKIFNYSLIPVLKVKIEQDVYKKNEEANFKEKYKDLKLSEIVDKIEKKLTEQDKTYIKYRDKILKNAQVKLSQKARAYVNGTGGDDATSEVNTKNLWGFVMAEEAWQYGLQGLEAQRASDALEVSQKDREFIKKFSKVEVITGIPEDEKARLIEGSKAYLSFLEEQRDQFHDQIRKTMSKSTLIKGHVGSALSIYVTLTIRDLFNVVTQGRFLEEKYKTMYIDKKGKKYTYGDFWSDTLTKYVDFRHESFYRTHITFASFVIAAESTRMIIPTSLVNKFYGLFDRTVYGYGGKLMRGMVGYPISTFLSMGVGMKVSEAVGQAMMLRHELASDAPEIKQIIGEIMTETNLSKGAVLSTSKSATSFVISGVIWDITRSIPKYYLKMRELNKNKCTYSYNDIIEMIKKDRAQSTAAKTWLGRNSLRVGNDAVVFIGAQFIENYLLRNMFAASLAEHNEKLDEYYGKLLTAEIDFLTKKIINTKGDVIKIHEVYDDLNGLIYLNKLIDGLRSEDKNVKICFNYGEGNIKNCIESIYAKVINPENVEWKKYVSPNEYYSDKTVKEQFKNNIVKMMDTTKTSTNFTNELKTNPTLLDKVGAGGEKIAQLSSIGDVQKKMMSYIESSDIVKSKEQLAFVFKLMGEMNKTEPAKNNQSELQQLNNIITNELTGLNTLSYDETVNRLTDLLKNVVPKIVKESDEDESTNQYTELNSEVIKALASAMFKRIDGVCGDKKDKFVQEMLGLKSNIIFNDSISFKCRALVIDIIGLYTDKQKGQDIK